MQETHCDDGNTVIKETHWERENYKKRWQENITRKGKKKILQEKVTKNITRKGNNKRLPSILSQKSVKLIEILRIKLCLINYVTT